MVGNPELVAAFSPHSTTRQNPSPAMRKAVPGFLV